MATELLGPWQILDWELVQETVVEVDIRQVLFLEESLAQIERDWVTQNRKELPEMFYETTVRVGRKILLHRYYGPKECRKLVRPYLN